MEHYQKDDRICLFGCVLVFSGDVISYNLTFFRKDSPVART
jgi:hypothetical protein